MADLPTIERIEARLDQYHGETRALIESMLVVVRDNAVSNRDVAIASRELRDEMRAALQDLREEVHANTQAIRRLLDRFDDGASPAN